MWQIVSRNMSNLTPAQLEQFESTFRYFDRDETNTLVLSEFTAALASLGLVYTVRNTCHVNRDISERTSRKRTLFTSTINSFKTMGQ